MILAVRIPMKSAGCPFRGIDAASHLMRMRRN